MSNRREKIIKMLKMNFDPFYGLGKARKFWGKGIIEEKIKIITEVILKLF